MLVLEPEQIEQIEPTTAGKGKIFQLGGKRIDVFNPVAEDFNIEVIAASQAKVCRYNGHCREFYSVAQHEVLCALEAMRRGYSPPLVKACFLHDAGESVTGDFVRPLKLLVHDKLAPLETKIQQVIWDRFGVSISDAAYAQFVKPVDNSVLMSEAKALCDNWNEWNWDGITLSGFKVRPWSWRRANVEFMCMYCRLWNAPWSWSRVKNELLRVWYKLRRK